MASSDFSDSFDYPPTQLEQVLAEDFNQAPRVETDGEARLEGQLHTAYIQILGPDNLTDPPPQEKLAVYDAYAKLLLERYQADPDREHGPLKMPPELVAQLEVANAICDARYEEQQRLAALAAGTAPSEANAEQSGKPGEGTPEKDTVPVAAPAAGQEAAQATDPLVQHAPAPAAIPTPAEAPEAAAASTPAAVPGEALAQVPSNAAQAPGDPVASGASTVTAATPVQKPQSIEQQMSAIALSPTRQHRVVFEGDRSVEAALFVKLEQEGLLVQRGGSRVITASPKKMEKMLDEVCKTLGVEYKHAMTMTGSRHRPDGSMGFFGRAKSLVSNNFNHRVDVFVVGDSKAREKALGELGAYMKKIDAVTADAAAAPGKEAASQAKYQKDTKVVLDKEGRLDISKGAATLNAGRALGDLVVRAKRDVVAHRQVEQERSAERIAQKNAKEDAAAGKQAGSAPATAASAAGLEQTARTQAAPVNAHAAGLATELNAVLSSSPDKLQQSHSHFDRNSGREVVQTQATAMLNRLNKPTPDELRSLPAEMRSKLLVQAAAVTLKAADGDLGKTTKPGESLSRTVDTLAREMREANPQAYAQQTKEAITKLVADKVLSAEQGERLAAHMAGERPLPPDPFSKGAAAAAEGAKEPAASEAGPKPAAPEDTKPPQEPRTEQAKEAPTKEPAAAQAPEATRDDNSPVAAQAGAAPLKEKSDELSAQAKDAAASETKAGARTASEPVPDKAQNEERAVPKEATRPETSAEPATPASSVAREEGKLPTEKETAAPPPARADTADAAAKEPTAPANSEPKKEAEQAKPQAASGEQLGEGTGSTTRADKAPAKREPAFTASSLHERVAQVAATEGVQPTRRQATALLATLDAARNHSLSKIDPRGPEAAQQTLERIGRFVESARTGEYGKAAAAQAESLGPALESWRKESARSMGEATREQFHGKSAGTEQAGVEATTKPSPTAAAPASAAARPDSAASSQAAAPGRENSGVSANTYEATQRIYAMMANPAGSFTNRDKSWNEQAVTRFAQTVASLNTNETAAMSKVDRNSMAVYANWVADSAREGKLPGFSGAAGKELSDKLSQVAQELTMQSDGKVPAGTAKEVTKAQNMTHAMGQREATKEATTQATDAFSQRRVQMAEMAAKEAIHVMFNKAPEQRTEADIRFVLKNGSNLTPENLRGLDQATVAKAAVAVGALVRQVRAGEFGDLNDMSKALQNNVVGAASAVSKLEESVSRDPSGSTALIKAHVELNNPAQGDVQVGLRDAGTPKGSGAEHKDSQGEPSQDQQKQRTEGENPMVARAAGEASAVTAKVKALDRDR